MLKRNPRHSNDAMTVEERLRRGFRYALALSHDPTQAEDLVQDAWLAILDGDKPQHIGYLLRTIRNRFIDLYRRQSLVPIESLDAMTGDAQDALAWLDETTARVDGDTLKRALGTLRPAEREVLYLAAAEGYSVREIAEQTGRPLGSTSSLIQRARRRIRTIFGNAPVRSAG